MIKKSRIFTLLALSLGIVLFTVLYVFVERYRINGRAHELCDGIRIGDNAEAFIDRSQLQNVKKVLITNPQGELVRAIRIDSPVSSEPTIEKEGELTAVFSALFPYHAACTVKYRDGVIYEKSVKEVN